MEKCDIKSIGIIGDGKMGRSLFNYLSGFSYKLTWINISQADKDLQKFTKKIKRMQHMGILEAEEARAKTNSVCITPDLTALSECELVIETINENIELKNALFKTLEPVLDKKTLLTSNSSSILPDLFSLPKTFTERFAGLHFFFPVETTDIVEIIPAKKTSELHLNTLKKFADNIGKTHLLQSRQTAFAANRYLLDIQAGFFNYCLHKKIPFTIADKTVREKMFANGIFLLMDYVGFNLLIYAIENYNKMSATPPHIQQLLQYLKENIAHSVQDVSAKACFYRQSESIMEHVDTCEDEIIAALKNLFRNFAEKYVAEEFFTEKEVRLVIRTFTDPLFDPFEE